MAACLPHACLHSVTKAIMASSVIRSNKYRSRQIAISLPDEMHYMSRPASNSIIIHHICLWAAYAVLYMLFDAVLIGLSGENLDSLHPFATHHTHVHCTQKAIYQKYCTQKAIYLKT